jgi:hypothetical protein
MINPAGVKAAGRGPGAGSGVIDFCGGYKATCVSSADYQNIPIPEESGSVCIPRRSHVARQRPTADSRIVAFRRSKAVDPFHKAAGHEHESVL